MMYDAPHITVVEDDELLREAIVNLFRKQHYTVVDFPSGAGVIDFIEQHHTDVLLCDIMLPDSNGLDLIKKLNEKSHLGKIFISAKSNLSDRLKGLSLGVDDYICKPLDQAELLLRVNALLKRLRQSPPHEDSANVAVLNLQLNLETRNLLYKNKVTNLGENEFKLLLYLKAQQGKICSREALVKTLSESVEYGQGRGLDILISRLRKKMTSLDCSSNYITTYRGKGYMLLLTGPQT